MNFLFTASRALGIPKSTLSKRLLELERQTGTRLVQRDTQRSDAKCTEANECVVCENADCSDKTSAYGLYPHVLKEALCKAVWNLPIQ